MAAGGELLSVSEAQQIVLRHCTALAPETMQLTSAALGLVLAENIHSDIDMPPHDKSLMDGYAVRSADLAGGRAVLRVLEEITAGRTPTRHVEPGQATRIMTGAPIPDGADAVVMVERTRMLDGGQVRIESEPSKPGQNILPRGTEMRRGDEILSAGAVLRPQEFGVLATAGRTTVKAHPAPVVTLMTTGDEVVEPSQQPGPGQIRNGNSPMLAAQITRAGGIPRYLGIARDSVEHLKQMVAEGLRSPMLVLSGGVSAGVADLVPGVLREVGVEAHFHKVAMKPGKPVFFGTLASSQTGRRRIKVEGGGVQPDEGSPCLLDWSSPCLVFGLPGNPVSSFVCFELFVRPAIRRLRGHADAGPMYVRATLTQDFAYKTDRPTYHPAWLEPSDDGWRVHAVPWFGSPDLRGLTRANALILFDAGEQRHQAGNKYAVLRIED